jgi:transposase-like protein
VRHVRPRPWLTVFGRWLVVQRVDQEGWTVAATAKAAGVSGETVYRWLRRWMAREVGPEAHSSRPNRSPRRLPARSEARICRLRQERKLGPHRLAA